LLFAREEHAERERKTAGFQDPLCGQRGSSRACSIPEKDPHPGKKRASYPHHTTKRRKETSGPTVVREAKTIHLSGNGKEEGRGPYSLLPKPRGPRQTLASWCPRKKKKKKKTPPEGKVPMPS